MARVNVLKFEQTHVLEFETVARGHHIYKSVWTPVVEEKLHCHHDTRDEAKSHDDYAIGIYKPVDTAMKEKETLVGHLPIEFRFFYANFWRVRRTVDYYFHQLDHVCWKMDW